MSRSTSPLKPLQHCVQTEPIFSAFIFHNGDPKNQWRFLTHEDVFDLASRNAAILCRKGIGYGHVVCSTLTKNPERLLTDMGILLAGAAVLKGEKLLPDKLNYLGSLRRAGCVAVVLEPDKPTLDKITQNSTGNLASLGQVVVTPENHAEVTCPSAPSLTFILYVECQIGDNSSRPSLRELQKEKERYVVDVQPSDVAYIKITLGRKDFTNMVPRTHASFLELGRTLCSTMGLQDGDVLFNEWSLRKEERAPVFYIANRVPQALLDVSMCRPLPLVLKQYQWDKNITLAAIHPARFSLFRDKSELLNLEGERKLRCVFTAGQPMQKRDLHVLDSVADSVHVAYRSAEGGLMTCLTVTADNRGSFREGDVGLSLPGVEIMLLDGKKQEIQEACKTGDIIVCGPTVFAGYLCPEKWDERVCFTSDKFFRTTDTGFWDGQGHLHVFHKEPISMIRTVQCHVHPSWWEVRLEKYPGVRSVVVVPVPVEPAPPSDNPIYQDLCAYVVLKAGRDYLTEEVLREFCQSLTLAPDYYTELHHVVPR